jgi:hypothetical protein
MSSPRIQKVFIGLTESLRKLVPAKDAFKTGLKWTGRDVNGKDACVIDLTATAWSTGNLRVIIVANPATDANNTAALHTQSHASGYFLDGSVSFQVYLEASANQYNDHAKFQREILHVLRGQLGAPIQLLLTANATEPTVNGVNGAGATAATNDAGSYNPYFFAVAGGV